VSAPLCADDRVVGVLQLLGSRDQPVDAAHLDRLGPLSAVLAAKLVDVAALARSAELIAPPVDDASPTEAVEIVPHPVPAPSPRPAAASARVDVAALTRAAMTPRHRDEAPEHAPETPARTSRHRRPEGSTDDAIGTVRLPAVPAPRHDATC